MRGRLTTRGMYEVKLAASPLGIKVPGCSAYHTSLIIGGTEFYFDSRGIVRGEGLQSHAHFRGHPTILVMGSTSISPDHMYKTLQPHFMAGTYDLLRKNCNSFSDCALSMLLNQRLEMKYRTLEKVGAAADQYTHAVKIATGGRYMPNKRADFWKSNDVAAQVAQTRV